MITEFNTLPKKIYYVQTAEACTVLDPDGEPLAEISAPGGYFPGIGSAEASTGTVTFSPAVKRVIGPFDLAPQLQLTLLGLLGGDQLPAGYTRLAYLESTGTQYIDTKAFNVYEYEMVYSTQNSNITILAGYVRQNDVRPFGIAEKSTVSIASTGIYLRSATVSAAVKNTVVYNESMGSQVKINGEMYNTSAYGAVAAADEPVEEALSVFLFACNAGGNGALGKALKSRVFSVKLTDDELNIIFAGIPALDETGAPCMFDLVSKTPVYNSGTGSFIAGVQTQTQLNKMLRILPDRTGLEVGTLQVRLADELKTPENESKLEAMLAKNWEISQAA